MDFQGVVPFSLAPWRSFLLLSWVVFFIFWTLHIPPSRFISLFWSRASSTKERSYIVGKGKVKFLLNLAHLKIFLLFLCIRWIVWLDIIFFQKFEDFSPLFSCFQYYKWQVWSHSDSGSSFKTYFGFLLCKSIVSSFSPLVFWNLCLHLRLFLFKVLDTWWTIAIWKFVSFIFGIFSWVISWSPFWNPYYLCRPPDLVLN